MSLLSMAITGILRHKVKCPLEIIALLGMLHKIPHLKNPTHAELLLECMQAQAGDVGYRFGVERKTDRTIVISILPHIDERHAARDASKSNKRRRLS